MRFGPLFRIFICVLTWFGGDGGARAQETVATGKPTPEQAARCATIANELVCKNCLTIYSIAGLRFPDEAETARTASLRMGIFKPEGPGPLPAVVLLHGCASLSDSENVAYWGTELLKAGYVAFIVDSWSQRGFPDGSAPRHRGCRRMPSFCACATPSRRSNTSGGSILWTGNVSPHWAPRRVVGPPIS